MIKANPFERQWAQTRDRVLEAVERVGSSGWYVLGPEVEAFEHDFARHCGAAAAVGCASGLDAIEIGLRAAGIRAGDEVVTTPLSAFATTLAIVRAGGVPVFVDVDECGLIDLERAAACAEERDASFVVPVHLFGHALDLDALERLSQERGWEVVEDAAQAVGARHRGRAVGTVGRATAYSFYPTKNLGALGDGGCLTTDDPLLEKEARRLRDYGQTARYRHDVMGMNSRLDELHAAILRSALLPTLAAWTTRRREIADRYRAGIASAHLMPAPVPEGSESCWHLFPVLVHEGRRDDLLADLQSQEIQVGIHYPELIPRQAALRDVPHVVVGELTHAERYSRDELSLPISPHLDDAEVDRVIERVNAWKP